MSAGSDETGGLPFKVAAAFRPVKPLMEKRLRQTQ